MTIPFLDAYLGFAFRNQPAIWPRLEAQGLTVEVARAAWDARSAAIGGNVLQWTPEKAIDLFGQPVGTTERSLTWDLALWPDHQFWGGIGDNGKLFFTDTFRLRDRPPVARLHSAELSDVHPALRLGWHCVEDIYAMLGPALVEDGWSPEHVLYYGPLADGTYLEVVSEYGLTTAVGTRAGGDWISLPAPPRPWWRRLWGKFVRG